MLCDGDCVRMTGCTGSSRVHDNKSLLNKTIILLRWYVCMYWLQVHNLFVCGAYITLFQYFQLSKNGEWPLPCCVSHHIYLRTLLSKTDLGISSNQINMRLGFLLFTNYNPPSSYKVILWNINTEFHLYKF